MTDIRKYSKLSSDPSFRLLRLLFCSPRKCTVRWRLTGRDFSDTHSLQSLFFFTLTVAQQVVKEEVLRTLELAYETSLKFLLYFLRRVAVYRIVCGNCFLPNYITNSIWTTCKSDAAFRSVPLTFVARGVYPAKTQGLSVTQVECYFSIIT